MLRSENVCDEALLAAIIKPSASEKERSMLQAAAQTPKKVVRVHETNSRQEEAKSKQHDDSISKLVSAVDVLTSKLSSLQQDFDNMKQKNVKSRHFLYTKCNVCTLNKVDNVRTVIYVVWRDTLQADAQLEATRETKDD